MQDPKSLNVSLIEVWKFGNYTWSFELRRIQITGTFNREASVEPNAEQLTTYASTQDRRVQSQPKLESLCADRSEAAQLATCTWDKIWQSLWNCIVSAVSPHWTARLFGCGVQNRLKSWERLMNKPEYFAGSQLLSLKVALYVAGLARHGITWFKQLLLTQTLSFVPFSRSPPLDDPDKNVLNEITESAKILCAACSKQQKLQLALLKQWQNLRNCVRVFLQWQFDRIEQHHCSMAARYKINWNYVSILWTNQSTSLVHSSCL